MGAKEPLSEQRKALIAENKNLCESKERRPVKETIVVEIKSLRRVEATEAKGGATYRACVGMYDAMNGNERVYPKLEWANQINVATASMIPAGRLTGAIDHPGPFEGGVLKNTPILWKTLEDNGDGTVDGEFTVIKEHSAGKDLQAQIDAGMAIGFSTSGCANARQPTEAEIKQYKIPETADYPVVIQNWELNRIDAVDNPSAPMAFKHESRGQRNESTEPTMKTLEDLKAAHPEIFALHEGAVKAVKDQAANEKTAELASLTAAKQKEIDVLATEKKDAGDKLIASEKSLTDLRAFCGDTLKTLGEKHGVDRPFREVSAKETQEKLDKLAAEAIEKDKKILDLEAKAKLETDAKVKAEGIAADVKRKAEVAAKSTTLLKDNKFSATISGLVAKLVDTASFTVEALETFVKEKTAEYEAVAKSSKTEKKDSITGTTMIDEDDSNKPNDEGGALSFATELAESL